MANSKISRADLKPGQSLCDFCTAKCCRYFALPVDEPEDVQDFEHMRWFLLHGNCAIFVEDGDWYLLVYGDCQHLLPDQRCAIYTDRPRVCREYSTDKCEYEDDAVYDKFFECAEQLWEYAEAVLPAKQWQSAAPNQDPANQLVVLKTH